MESRQKKIFGRFGDDPHTTDIADTRSLHDAIEANDLTEHILSESKNLPPKEYLVFCLRDIQDFSIEEIAEVAGMSIGSVKTNLCYARRRVRNAINRLQENEHI
jgi:RNA polymerase sigma-70 factor (ECF subfamily)